MLGNPPFQASAAAIEFFGSGDNISNQLVWGHKQFSWILKHAV